MISDLECDEMSASIACGVAAMFSAFWAEALRGVFHDHLNDVGKGIVMAATQAGSTRAFKRRLQKLGLFGLLRAGSKLPKSPGLMKCSTSKKPAAPKPRPGSRFGSLHHAGFQYGPWTIGAQFDNPRTSSCGA
jgi:hypothetical protein